jgi:hypothetical protein
VIKQGQAAEHEHEHGTPGTLPVSKETGLQMRVAVLTPFETAA